MAELFTAQEVEAALEPPKPLELYVVVGWHIKRKRWSLIGEQYGYPTLAGATEGATCAAAHWKHLRIFNLS